MTETAGSAAPPVPAGPAFPGAGVVVTGAAQGIGRAIAEQFAAAGAYVVLLDLDGELAAAAAAAITASVGSSGGPGSAQAVAGSVTDRAAIRAAIEAAVARAGHLDVFVAHAGIAEEHPLLEVTDEAWERIMGVNVTGVFRGVQEAGRTMRDQGTGGAIVATASTNGFQVEENLVPYSTSKGAVTTFVRAAALDLIRHGIRVNAVAPGVVRTRIAEWVIEHPVIGPQYLKKIPLGRFGEPADIARAVLWLASPASEYVLGQTIVLDGGQTLGIPFDDGGVPTEAIPE